MDKAIKKRAFRRLKIIEGQIRSIQNVLGKEHYCIDITIQTSAIKQALSGVEGLIL